MTDQTNQTIQLAIERAISSKNLNELRRISKESGFLNEENRRQIWPLFLGLNLSKLKKSSATPEDDSAGSRQSVYFDQLQKDTNRSIHGLNLYKNESQANIKVKQDQLLELLERLMKQQPELHYYQGYHDVATIFLVLFGVEQGFHMSKQAANTFFRQAIYSHSNKNIYQQYPLIHSLDKSAILMMQITQKIVYDECPMLKEILEEIGGAQFTLSWILTWFSHSFQDISYSYRVFDLLLCSRPETIAYLAAAFILVTFDQIKDKIEADGDEMPMEIVFSFYQNINKAVVDFNKWFNLCEDLQTKYPFSQIFTEYPFPKDSNLIEEVFKKLLPEPQQTSEDDNKHNKMFDKMKNLVSIKNAAYLIVGAAVAYQATKYVNIKILKAIGSSIATAIPFAINAVSSKQNQQIIQKQQMQ